MVSKQEFFLHRENNIWQNWSCSLFRPTGALHLHIIKKLTFLVTLSLKAVLRRRNYLFSSLVSAPLHLYPVSLILAPAPATYRHLITEVPSEVCCNGLFFLLLLASFKLTAVNIYWKKIISAPAQDLKQFRLHGLRNTVPMFYDFRNLFPDFSKIWSVCNIMASALKL